jgi:hypothetical protein
MIEHRNEKGELHRTDGPALVYADGSCAWFVDGKRHRVDGPAVEYKDGYQEWWVDGKRHRVDGPAVVRADGDCEWWVDGELIKSEQSGERKQKREMTNYKESAANYKELREATTELLKAIDGLFPTDGPVKARVRAALKEKE